MNVRMSVDNLSAVTIGYAGERSVESVTFDYSAWQTAYGEGVLFLHVLRPMDEGLYPVVLAVDGTDATWTISAADTAQTGHGEAQLEYRVNNALKKSAVFGVNIIRSLIEGEQPEGWDTFMEDMEEIAATAVENAGIATQKATEASESADDAEASASASQESAEDSEAWAVGQRNGVNVTDTDETYQNNAKFYAGLAEDSALNAAQSESNVESAEARINETVDDFDTTVQTALGDIDTAQENATTAINSAKTQAVTEINDLVTEASGYADDAEQAKTDAQTSASNASQSATDANTAKSDAQTARTDAQTARDNAQTYSRDSEAWANGTRNGSAIPSTDVAYEKNSKYWAEQAQSTVTDLADDVSELQTETAALKDELSLLSETIPDTVQTYTFTDGNVSAITHTGANSTVVRTDTFTYGTGTITEMRTLSTGESLTIVTNLETLETTITFADAA